MKKFILLTLLILANVAHAAPPLTLLGQNTNDTVLITFFVQKTNADRIIQGLNANGSILLGTNLFPGFLPAWSTNDPSSFGGAPVSTNGAILTNIFTAKGQIIVWDGTNAVKFDPGTNNQMIVYDPTTPTGLRATNQPTSSGGGSDIGTNDFTFAETTPGFDVTVTNGTRRAMVTVTALVQSGSGADAVVRVHHVHIADDRINDIKVVDGDAVSSPQMIGSVSFMLSPGDTYYIENTADPLTANTIVSVQTWEW